MDKRNAEQKAAEVYWRYGLVMHRLQLLEMNLWELKAIQMKPGVQLDQGLAKLNAGDSKALFGGLVEELSPQAHWPTGMVERMRWAVRVRNYLAHRFLREFFTFPDSAENYEAALSRLEGWGDTLSQLNADMEAHTITIGGEPDPDDIAALTQMMPTRWPITNADDRSAPDLA